MPDDALAEPLFDTFAVARDGGNFYVTAPGGDNARVAAALSATLGAFAGLARGWSADLCPEGGAGAAPVRLIRGEEDPAAYADRLDHAVATFPAPLHVVEVLVDVRVYVRTAEAPEVPARRWVRLHDRVVVFGGDRVHACLALNETAFAPWGPGRLDNRALHAQNQPLLEAALRRWEERLRPIGEPEGYEGIHRHGFRER